MRINQNTKIIGNKVVLVPYKKKHVAKYVYEKLIEYSSYVMIILKLPISKFGTSLFK